LLQAENAKISDNKIMGGKNPLVDSFMVIIVAFAGAEGQ
jgi:hypothetical protein